MDGTARCISCFRIERRRDGEILEVVTPGGARRPGVPGELAIWRTLRRVKAGELGAPVAVCSACGQPMFATEGALPAVPRWELTLPDGPIAVGPDGRVIGADGPVDEGADADTDRRIEAHYKPQLEEKLTAGQMGFGLFLLAAVGGIGVLAGACDCPSVAMALAVPAVASAVTKNRRDR